MKVKGNTIVYKGYDVEIDTEWFGGDEPCVNVEVAINDCYESSHETLEQAIAWIDKQSEGEK